MQRRSALRRIGASTIAIAAGVPSAVQAGPPPRRGPPADVVVPDDHSTIQGAIDAADPGATVLIDGGTYREQVVVAEDLALEGRNGATIEAPDGMDTFSLAESGTEWAPIVFAYGGNESGGTVSGSETVDVDISGLAIDGRGNTGQAGSKTGILYRNVGRTSPSRIASNSVTDVGTPGPNIGVVAYGDSDVRIEDNHVTGFGRGGIGANGNGGEQPSPNALIRNNYLDSESEAGGSAPNGVQIGYGATAQVRDNTIANCRYANSVAAPWQASGILIFESDGVAVQGNTLENNDVAVAASAWGWFADSADNNKIQRNTITDALIGVNLRATAWDPYSGEDPSVSNNKVVNNEIDDTAGEPGGEFGVAIESNDRHDGFDPAAENNKVVRNSISGFEEQVSNEGSGTKVRAIEP